MAELNLTPEEMQRRWDETVRRVILMDAYQEAGTVAVNPHQRFNVAFLNPQGAEVGWLRVENDELVFTGNADESARVFFESLKMQVDAYIAERLSGK